MAMSPLLPTEMVAATVDSAVSTTSTTPAAVITYSHLPSGVTARADGVGPTGITSITRSLDVSITEMELEPPFVTYARVPSRVTAARTGPEPTGIVPATMPVAVSITVTRFAFVSATEDFVGAPVGVAPARINSGSNAHALQMHVR